MKNLHIYFSTYSIGFLLLKKLWIFVKVRIRTKEDRMIQTFKGTSRVVVAIPFFGIVIKIARISLAPETFWHLLLDGVASNFCEWWFTITHRKTFIAPTYISCGLFSVARYAQPFFNRYDLWPDEIFGSEAYLWKQYLTVVPEEVLRDDDHHWLNISNFGLLNGQIVICDYGAPKTRVILHIYGKALAKLKLADLVSLVPTLPGR